MGQTIELTAGDGHRLHAYEASPSGRVRGAVVVVQEIFGVNAHIRSVADGYAASGYRVLAPALFDPVRPNIELGYADADVAEGRTIRGRISFEQALSDDAVIAKGKATFDAKGCGACHQFGSKLVGPDLTGLTERRSLPWIAKMIRYPEQMTKTDPVAKELFRSLMVQMTDQGVTDADLPALVSYLDEAGEDEAEE